MSLHPPLPQTPRSAAAKAPAAARFDPRLPPALRTFLEAEIARTPLTRPVTFALLSPLSETAAGTTVLFHQGPVSPEWAPLFNRDEPLLLCALRADGLPSAWDWSLLHALLSSRSLRTPQVRWHQAKVDSVSALQRAAELVAVRVGDVSPGAPVAKLASDVAHELLANALLDAPVDARGVARYAERRDQAPQIAAEDACDFAVAVEDGRIFLSVVDRFGRLSPLPLARMLARYGQRVQTDTSGGGAGLGLRQIVEGCDALMFQVLPGRRTEALAVIDLAGPRRRAGQTKTLFFRTVTDDVRGGQLDR